MNKKKRLFFKELFKVKALKDLREMLYKEDVGETITRGEG